MRPTFPKELEAGRELIGPYATRPGERQGRFILSPGKGPLARLLVIVSEGSEEVPWEHASVSPIGKHRVPTWEEMCFVKRLVWEPSEWVVQFHPAESEYVNCHPHVLHLWKPVGVELPTPPSEAVGPKRLKVLA